jgi:hypothetical protein
VNPPDFSTDFSTFSPQITLTRPTFAPFNAVPAPTVNPPPRKLNAAEQEVAEALHNSSRGTLALRRAEAFVAQYGRFAVMDAAQTLAERHEAVRNPAGFVTSLLAARYGRELTDGMDVNAVMLAESLYTAVRWLNPRSGLRWRTSCELVRQYGESAVQAILTALNYYTPGTLKNPAGFVINQLRAGNPGKVSVKSRDDAVKLLVDATRRANPERALSRSRARELVKQYGVKAVVRALNVVQHRTNITNPAGFLIVFLRSEARR